MKILAILLVPVAVAVETGWQWVPIKRTKCWNGEETGVYIRKSTSGKKDLGVYLYGGGACFNKITCAMVASSPHPGNTGSSGIFDSRSDNPLVDYNWMAVPYCTGDVHGGDAVKLFQGKLRNFHGSANLKLMMTYATQTFKDVETLFVTGESAGGFGAVTSYHIMRGFYPKARGVLMDDSGPVLDDEAIPQCLQEEWRQTWNLNKNLGKDCPCNNNKGNLVSVWSYIPKLYPNDSFSLVSSQHDGTISSFFGFGNFDCYAILPLGYDKLLGGLTRLAKTTPVYIIPGNGHTHTSSGEFFSRVVNGTKLYKWIDQLIDVTRPDPGSVLPTAMDIQNEMHPRNQSIVV